MCKDTIKTSKGLLLFWCAPSYPKTSERLPNAIDYPGVSLQDLTTSQLHGAEKNVHSDYNQDIKCCIPDETVQRQTSAPPEQNNIQISRTLGSWRLISGWLYAVADNQPGCFWGMWVRGATGCSLWVSSIRAETGEAVDPRQLLLPDTNHFRTPPFEI